MIKKLRSGKFRLYTASGSRPLGPPTTKKAAAKQELAIRLSKLRKAGRIPRRRVPKKVKAVLKSFEALKNRIENRR